MLLVVRDPGKGNPRLSADFQIQRFSFRFRIKAQPKAKATMINGTAGSGPGAVRLGLAESPLTRRFAPGSPRNRGENFSLAANARGWG
jgi:hypothetical protein